MKSLHHWLNLILTIFLWIFIWTFVSTILSKMNLTNNEILIISAIGMLIIGYIIYNDSKFTMD